MRYSTWKHIHRFILSELESNLATGIITDTPPGLGMLVKVIGPDGKVMLDKVYGSRGKFAFTTHKPGNHKMCLRHGFLII